MKKIKRTKNSKSKKVTKKKRGPGPAEIAIADIIETGAELAHKEFGFNPLKVIWMQLYHGDFFENIPASFAKKAGSYCLRDSTSHAAIVFNINTKKVRLVKPATYWPPVERKFWKEGLSKGALKEFQQIRAETQKLLKAD